MILTCPACATSYFVSDGAVGPEGRKVRCQACSEVWRAIPEEPLELSISTEPRSFSPSDHESKSEPEPELASLAETPAPELPKAFRARAEQQRRVRRAATHGAIWGGMACVFLGMIVSALMFRVEVVDAIPRAASAYAMIGAPVNPLGLEFEAVSASDAPHRPDALLVSGAIRNIRDREIVAPTVSITLLDAVGAVIGTHTIPIDSAPVLPGKVQGFAAVLPNPGGKTVDLDVDFIIVPEAPKAPVPGTPESNPAQDSARADNTVVPASVAAGLRPASLPSLASRQLPAVDARPVKDSALAVG